MGIEWDSPRDSKGLTGKRPPALAVEALAAVGQVRLAAFDIPPGILRRFYEGIVGFTFIPGEGPDLLFRYLQREILLQRDRAELGHAAFLIRQFDDALMRLRDRQIGYELLHTDGGLCRMAITRDPAGNWIHLVETRAF
jgi:hypothetical protein